MPDGKRQRYPLGGASDNYFLEIGGRYGMGHGFEISARALLKGVSYQFGGCVAAGSWVVLDEVQRVPNLLNQIHDIKPAGRPVDIVLH